MQVAAILPGLARCSLVLMLLLAMLTYCVEGENNDGSGWNDDSEEDRSETTGDTFNDDEDFNGKVPVTFFATSTSSCGTWKEVDRNGSSLIIINKMLIYVGDACECGFNDDYLTPFQFSCDTHAGTLLVSTSMSLPFNHQRHQLVNYLENWLKTEPTFTKTLINGGRTTVSVVDLETTLTAYSPPPLPLGSGDTDDEDGSRETPHVVGDEERGGRVEEGSGGSGSNGDIVGSSLTVTVDFGAILIACAAPMLVSMFKV